MLLILVAQEEQTESVRLMANPCLLKCYHASRVTAAGFAQSVERLTGSDDHVKWRSRLL